MEFKSQVCTTVEQSKRLLELGLKRETADMTHCYEREEHDDKCFWNVSIDDWGSNQYITDNYIPAWSLARLIELMPFRIGKYDELGVIVNKETIEIIDLEEGTVDLAFDKDNVYDNIIECIEWLIKKGEFNKELLAK